ncbi:ribose 5-phosphate isomerase B [Chloroflexota bacterium]
MRIAIGCDHRGLKLKQMILELLPFHIEKKYTCADLGTYSDESVDYPDIADKVATEVAGGLAEFGILICSTGIGMCIAANKVKGIRAALCHDAFGAGRARRHNNANILCLSAEEGKARVPSILEAFLTTEFEGGRHQQRLDKISAMENRR